MAAKAPRPRSGFDNRFEIVDAFGRSFSEKRCERCISITKTFPNAGTSTHSPRTRTPDSQFTR